MVASVASVASSNFGVAMGILTQVGELVQNVPYVKVVAALLLQIKQMKDVRHSPRSNLFPLLYSTDDLSHTSGSR